MTRRGWGIDLERVPWSLWAYVALMAVSVIVLFVQVAPARPAIFGAVFLGTWAYFLLRGVRWLWIATTAFLAISLVVDLAIATGTWFGDATGLVQLVLLLLPATRHFFAPEKTRETG